MGSIEVVTDRDIFMASSLSFENSITGNECISYDLSTNKPKYVIERIHNIE